MPLTLALLPAIAATPADSYLSGETDSKLELFSVGVVVSLVSSFFSAVNFLGLSCRILQWGRMCRGMCIGMYLKGVVGEEVTGTHIGDNIIVA